MHLWADTRCSDVDPDKDLNQTSYKITDLPQLTMNVCLVHAVQSLTGTRQVCHLNPGW